MIDISRFGGHGGGRNMDSFEGADAEDFLEALEADEQADGDEDHEAALASWREAQEQDGGDELECGLTRHQLRTAAKVLFSGLAEVMQGILGKARSRGSDGEERRSGALVSGSQIAGLAVALQLPGFEKGSKVARKIGVTRASVSIWSAEFGRKLGVTSEQSARKQRDGVLARARVKAGLKPKVGEVIHAFTAADRERPETRKWLESLPPDQREQARLALKGKVS
jgi:hypothetical protein